MSYRNRKRKAIAEINVVPYIDVMLVLLIIFMVTAPLLTEGVKVDLPQTTDSAPVQSDPESPEPFVMTVDAEGDFFIDDRAYDAAGIVRYAKALYLEKPTMVVNFTRDDSNAEQVEAFDAEKIDIVKARAVDEDQLQKTRDEIKKKERAKRQKREKEEKRLRDLKKQSEREKKR